MSKLLNLGVSLAAVIEASTVNPARAIGRDDLGTLREGTVGDITVLELLEGEFEYQDTAGVTMVGRQKLASVLTLVQGQPLSDMSIN
jgi:dihydroorotase